MPLTPSARRATRKIRRLDVNVPAINPHSDLWDTEEDFFSRPALPAEQAITLVQARYPRIKAGYWTAERVGPDWEVRHRYAGRRTATVEIYVRPDGSLDGSKIL